LKKLMDLHAPEVIVRNEKRMLQEAVDALSITDAAGAFCAAPITGTEVALRHAERQTGTLRQNLLGKRVDYRTFGHRGWSRAQAAPVRLAEEDGAELFKPFIYTVWNRRETAPTSSRQRMVEQQEPIVWEFCKKSSGPSSHAEPRAYAPSPGFQAFEPVLVEGKQLRSTHWSAGVQR